MLYRFDSGLRNFGNMSLRVEQSNDFRSCLGDADYLPY